MRLAKVRGGAWTIRVVLTEKGDCPFKEWLDGLPYKARTKINLLLDRVSSNGSPKNTDISHQIGEAIWQWTPTYDHRVAWFYDDGQVIIVSHGYGKSGNKTSKADIERAETLRKQYLIEKGEGTLILKDEVKK